MLTRVGFDGSIRQTLLPVAAHDVEVAPDRSIGVLCSMDGEQHTAFDPDTLEMAAIGAVARRRLARRRPCGLSRRRQDRHPVGARAVDALSGQSGEALRPADRPRSEDAEDRRDLFDAWHRPARHPADRRRQIHRRGQLRLDRLAPRPASSPCRAASSRRRSPSSKCRAASWSTSASPGSGDDRTAASRGRPARPHLRDPGALRQRPRRCTAARRRGRGLRDRHHHRARLQLHGGGDAEIRRGAQPG